MLYVTLRQYEYLVAVSKAASLTEAAGHLNVSQPSLSVAITRIEERLGRSLFARGKGMPFRLTPYGRSVVSRAEALLAQAAGLEDPAGIDAPERLDASIGFFDDLAPRWLAPALGVLGSRVPEVRISPVTGSFADLAKALGDGRIAMALTWDLGLDAGYERAVIARVSPHAFVPIDDPLASSGSVTLKRLAERPLVLFDDGLSIRHVLGLFDKSGPMPRVVHRAASLEVMRSLAAHGMGVGISYTNPPCPSSYDNMPLASIRIVDRAATEPVVLAWPSGADAVLPTARIIAALKQVAA